MEHKVKLNHFYRHRSEWNFMELVNKEEVADVFPHLDIKQ